MEQQELEQIQDVQHNFSINSIQYWNYSQLGDLIKRKQQRSQSLEQLKKDKQYSNLVNNANYTQMNRNYSLDKLKTQ